MRFCTWWWLLLPAFFSSPAIGASEPSTGQPPPVLLEFGGYAFGQSPAANMTCFTGYCKSQAPGGDGRVTFPFSVFDTPGASSTLSGLMVINPRYTFWEDRLFRVMFQVDCTPLETEECLADIVKTLDREYGLTPFSKSNIEQFTTRNSAITEEFMTDSGAFVKIRAVTLGDEPRMPMVDIVDRGMADLVGTTLSPTYKPKKPDIQEIPRKP